MAAPGLLAAPVISEFLASNPAGGRLDEDGDASDWIELYNPGSQTADLGGSFLSDDPAQPDKWRFPEATLLPAGRFLLVFASGKDRAVAGGELHTSFSLNTDGESVLLTAPDGTTQVAAIAPYPTQFEGISYGLGVTGSTTFSMPVTRGSACAWHVPGADIGAGWQLPDYDDSGWTTAQTGIGFGYSEFTGEAGDVGKAMQSINASIYIRIPFDVQQPGDVLRILLRMQFEDGFVAFLNGRQVAAFNAPDPLTWDAAATASRRDTDAVQVTEFELSFGGSLVPGENILAIQGLNGSRGGSDLLVLPELVLEQRLGEAGNGYFVAPSPGSANGPRIDGFVAPLTFDRERGFYDAPLEVAIASATDGAIIRFTTDGSVPTMENGSTYSSPVEIASTTVLRATGFRPGWSPAPVETQTYLLLDDVLTQDRARAVQKGLPASWRGTSADYDMDPDIVDDPVFGPRLKPALKAIPSISLVTSPEDMFGSEGVYSNPDGTGERWERGVSMEFIEPETAAAFQIDCGVRAQGGAFRSFGLTRKKSLRLLFKGIYGETKLRYPLFGSGNGAVEEFDTLTLRMEANDGWQWDGAGGQPQYARDEFGRRSQLALGQPSAHGRNVHLYINGFYWGVYDLVERPDAGFAEAYLGVPKEQWDGINTGGGINGGSTRPWRELLALTNAIRTAETEAERTAAFYRVMGLRPDGSDDPALESFLDADNFIDYLLVNWYMGNTDWPHNNYYCGRGQGPDSAGYRFFMWDAEWTLLIGGSLNTDQTRALTGVAEPQRGLAESLEYRVRFGDRAHRALFHDGPLTPDACVARYDDFVRNHPLILTAESARWGDQHRSSSPYTPTDWQREYERLRSSWFPRRTDVFISQLRRTGLYPDLDAPEFSQRGGFVPAGFALTMTVPEGSTVYYTLDGSDPRLPVLGDASASEVELVAEDAARTFRVPLGAQDGFAADGIAWSSPDFVEPGDWQQTAGPVGYESGGGGYAELVAHDLQPLMQGQSAAVLVRIPFFLTQEQLEQLDFLVLRAKYDDGFAAFVNGVPVASANAPLVVDGTSTATASHRDADALVFEEFSAAAGVPALRAGVNILGVIGLNQGRGGSDFFNSVQLTGGSDQTISGQARVYSGPVPLAVPSLVKARALAGEEWSALEQAFFAVDTVPAAAGNLVVSEFSYRPPAPTASEREAGFDSRSDFEFIEVANIGSSAVSLAGVVLDGGVRLQLPGDAILAPAGFGLLVANLDAFRLRYGAEAASAVFGVFSGKLNNGGDRVALMDAAKQEISVFRYADAAPWPAGDAAAGFSLELVARHAHPDPDVPANWRVSGDAFGSPGRDASLDTGFTGDPAADLDGDGISALLEYAFGTSDTDASAFAETTVVAAPGGSLQLRFQVNASADDVAITFETSSDLAEWEPLQAGLISDVANGADAAIRMRTYSLPETDADSRYLRLKVELKN